MLKLNIFKKEDTMETQIMTDLHTGGGGLPEAEHSSGTDF